jgi:hypothetical protein
MAHLRRRIEQLEEKMEQHDAQLAWPEVDAALTRQTARVRLVVGERLGTTADHYAMLDARMRLGEDTPEREAADLETISRWHRVHGLRDDTGDVRQRLMLRLDAIARRVRDRLQHSQMWIPS